MILFFDTETTGLVKNWNDPSDERNPKLVQLGLALTTNEGRLVNTFSSIVKPINFEIPKEAAAVHGITTDMALRHGTEPDRIKHIFIEYALKAHLIVAHNFKFDSIVMQHCLNGQSGMFIGIKSFCTMLESTPICQLPSKRGGFKWPSLKEAYDFFFHEELKDAHDAFTDVMACKRIYFEGLMKLQKETVSQAKD